MAEQPLNDQAWPATRLIALYLPQFHPVPENDKWWGRGFTEWTNVSKAKPLFPGHYQPHLPADMGFYDLRLPEVRQAQADLARQHGIHGFCYYHYWFNGKRILERPFNEVLASGEPDFPFCLCWANENWTRRWDGQEHEVLLAQSYSEQDDRAHLQWLASAFADRRYIRVDGKPLFLVYRVSKLDAPERTTEVWREEAERLGIGELFLCRVDSFSEGLVTPQSQGFDASMEFAPYPQIMGNRINYHGRRATWSRKLGLIHQAYGEHGVYDYKAMVNLAMTRPLPTFETFRCATPSWDNSARRNSDATIFLGSTPELYEQWLSFLIKQAETKPVDHRIIFINAWNEWAEGNHLEPCQKYGLAYLEATRKALIEATASSSRASSL